MQHTDEQYGSASLSREPAHWMNRTSWTGFLSEDEMPLAAIFQFHINTTLGLSP
jgi:hypothetical protein